MEDSVSPVVSIREDVLLRSEDLVVDVLHILHCSIPVEEHEVDILSSCCIAASICVQKSDLGVEAVLRNSVERDIIIRPGP